MRNRLTIVVTAMWIQLQLALHSAKENPDGGYSSETVILTAFLAGLGLAVAGIFGPRILTAARDVVFSD
jgi:hypothetical protein